MSWWEFLFQIALWQQLKIPSSEYFRQADKPGINVSIIVQQEVFATLYFLKFETEKYSCCLLILFFIVLLRSIKDHSHGHGWWTISSSKVRGLFLYICYVICYFDAGLSKRREKERAGKRQQVWRSTLTDQSLLSLESSQLFEVVESFLLV